MSGYTYLSSPYTHPDPAVREQRFQAVCRAAAKLMEKGECVFAPICHSHPIDVAGDLPKTVEFWKQQDIPLLRHASKLAMLMLDGWQASQGMKWEYKMALEINIPVAWIKPEQL